MAPQLNLLGNNGIEGATIGNEDEDGQQEDEIAPVFTLPSDFKVTPRGHSAPVIISKARIRKT